MQGFDFPKDVNGTAMISDIPSRRQLSFRLKSHLFASHVVEARTCTRSFPNVSATGVPVLTSLVHSQRSTGQAIYRCLKARGVDDIVVAATWTSMYTAPVRRHEPALVYYGAYAWPCRFPPEKMLSTVFGEAS